MIAELYTSAFCGPCHATRAVLADAARLVPALQIEEFDVVRHEERAEAAGIRSTPTVILRDAEGAQLLRAEGVPTVPQVLQAVAAAL